MKQKEFDLDKVTARMKATHPSKPATQEELKFNLIETANVRNHISELAAREGVSDEQIRADMMEAINASKNSSDPRVQELWKTFHYDGDEPTPEEFILWFVGLLLITMDEKQEHESE